MSLINEALKRAKQLQESGGAAATGVAMRPVEALHQADAGTGRWLPALIGVVFSISMIFLWQWSHPGALTHVRAKTAAMQADATTAAAPGIPAVAVAQEKTPKPAAPAVLPAAPPTAAGTGSNDLAAAAATDETIPVISAVVEPPQAPPVTYKLQSLVYSSKSPSAVINGKIVFKGDRVAGARVLAIDPDAVLILTPAGQTNLLELP